MPGRGTGQPLWASGRGECELWSDSEPLGGLPCLVVDGLYTLVVQLDTAWEMWVVVIPDSSRGKENPKVCCGRDGGWGIGEGNASREARTSQHRWHSEQMPEQEEF